MNHMCLRSRLNQLLPRFVFILCLLQPILDVASFWLDELALSNAPTTILRFVMLALVMLLGFVLSKRKRYYVLLALVLGALTAGHIFACYQWGYGAPLTDLANALRIYQLPMMTLAFVSMVKANEACMDSIKKGFFWCLMICAVVELLSVITGTNPYTYEKKQIGILGWFYFANSQSAILSMLVPVALCFVLEKKQKLLPFAFVCAVSFVIMYFFATRLAYLAMIGTGLGLVVCLLILHKTAGMNVKKSVAVLLVGTVIFVAAYMISPMYRNNSMVYHNETLKQQDIDEKVAADEKKALEAGLEGEALQTARLESAYMEYLEGPAGRFGVEKTAEHFDYSTYVNDIANVRKARRCFCSLLMQEQGSLAFWFGMEREDMRYNDVIYDVENDFHGVFYLSGLAGLILMIVFLGWFLVRIVFALVRDFKKTFTLPAVGCGLALVCCLVHAYLTAGVLRRPNVTFYLAALLAMAYGLTRKEEIGDEA